MTPNLRNDEWNPQEGQSRTRTSKSDHEVEREEQQALHIIALSILDEGVDKQNRDEKADCLKVCKIQSEVMASTRWWARSSVRYFPHYDNRTKDTHIHPTMISKGTTNAAIWIELPTQMVMVNSILFFIAIHTEVVCSAALATMGRRIRPMNALLIW